MSSLQATPGLLGAPQQAGDVATGREFGGAVALDRALGHRGAAPVLHDPQAVGHDGVGGVGVAEGGPPVDQLVAQLFHDGGHLAQRQVHEPQVLVGRDGDRRRPFAVSGRPRHPDP